MAEGAPLWQLLVMLRCMSCRSTASNVIQPMRYVITLLAFMVSTILPSRAVDDQPLDIAAEFQKFCLDTEMNARSLAELIAEQRLERVPRVEVTQYMQGILPFHINAYSLRGEAYLVWSVQGDVFGSHIRQVPTGERPISDPISPDHIIPDILGVGVEPHIGSTSCAIMSVDNVLPSYDDVFALEFQGISPGAIKLSRHVVLRYPSMSVAARHFVWEVGDELHVNYIHAYDASFSDLSASRAVRPDEDVSSYLFPH